MDNSNSSKLAASWHINSVEVKIARCIFRVPVHTVLGDHNCLHFCSLLLLQANGMRPRGMLRAVRLQEPPLVLACGMPRPELSSLVMPHLLPLARGIAGMLPHSGARLPKLMEEVCTFSVCSVWFLCFATQ